MSLQNVAPEKFQGKISQELKELEDQKTKEAFELLGRKHKLGKLEKESSKDVTRDGATSGPKVVFFRGLGQLLLGFLLALLGTRDADDATSASSWTSPARWKERDWGSADLEGERRSWRSKDVFLGPKADPWISKGRWATGQLGQRLEKKEVKE